MEEPWLRGVQPDLDPVIAHLLRTSEQIREETSAVLRKFNGKQPWSCEAGFHARHLAGSTNRLCTYLEGEEVSTLPDESTGEESPADLERAIHEAFDRYDNVIRSLAPEDFGAIRHVGRKRLPVTAISLAIHIAEHGQRHTGQLITTAKRI